jgi:hypothetical protein
MQFDHDPPPRKNIHKSVHSMGVIIAVFQSHEDSINRLHSFVSYLISSSFDVQTSLRPSPTMCTTPSSRRRPGKSHFCVCLSCLAGTHDMICITMFSLCFKTHDFRFHVSLHQAFSSVFQSFASFPQICSFAFPHIASTRNVAFLRLFFVLFFGSAVHSWSRGARCWIDWRRCPAICRWWHSMGTVSARLSSSLLSV